MKTCKYSSNNIEMSPIPEAVKVNGVKFTYSRSYLEWITNPFKKKNEPILKGISLSVPKGKIYALLGASGCGKTTLLQCILGQLPVMVGEVKIFGRSPKLQKSNLVGYMPQELALFPELTIFETLKYFSQICKMPKENVGIHIRNMINFLKLPVNENLVKQLSGGQQRRVSLACALIHQPPLLILDEPTVGVDPLLRVTIWKHLEELCTKKGVTVIMTTHYIEEARAAETVGFMRNGQILAQSNPSSLLQQYNSPTLEDVFLKLAKTQDQNGEEQKNLEDVKVNHVDINKISKKDYHPTDIITPTHTLSMMKGQRSSLFDMGRFKALFTKNILTMQRNQTVTLFSFLLPTIQFILFMLVATKSPKNIPVSVVNDESPAHLTGMFMKNLNLDTLILRPEKSMEAAIMDVRKGKSWAAVHLDGNYSKAINRRRKDLLAISNRTLAASSIRVQIDLSDPVVGSYVIFQVFQAFQTTMSKYLPTVGDNARTFSPPVTVAEIIYGTLDRDNMSMAEYFIPIITLFLAFFSTAVISSLSSILEQKNGLLKRSLVSGVQPTESLAAQVATQTILLCIQMAILFCTTFFYFEVPSRGSLSLLLCLLMFQGFCGTMYGFAVASLFPDEVSAAIVVMGSLMPSFWLNGLMWPLSLINQRLYNVTIFLPQTLSVEAFRVILSRGWTLANKEVQLGFASTGAWIVGFLAIAVIFYCR